MGTYPIAHFQPPKKENITSKKISQEISQATVRRKITLGTVNQNILKRLEVQDRPDSSALSPLFNKTTAIKTNCFFAI